MIQMRANSENEWKEDMERAACDPETDSMGYAAFHCAFFQLAQLWVNHLHVPDLVKFLETFLPVTRCLFASESPNCITETLWMGINSAV